MKKKILLMATMIAALMCLFTVVISAAEVPEWSGITVVEGMSDKSTFGSDGTAGATSRVLMSDGMTYPAYYICANSSTLGINFSELNSKTGKSYAAANVIRIEIPKGTVTVTEALRLSKGYEALLTVVIPEGVTTINDYAFRASNIVGELVIPEGCTKIGSYAFKETDISKVTLPSTLTTIGASAFEICHSLVEVYSNAPKIGRSMFYDCDELQKITLNNVIEIGESAFCNPNGGISKVDSLVLPEGLTTIGSYAFTRMQITSLVLPSTLTNIGNSVFTGSTTLKKLVVLGTTLGGSMFSGCSALNELVFTENFTTFENGALGTASENDFTTYYTGTDHERIKAICSSTSRFSKATYCSYENYLSGNYKKTTYMVIYDLNLCVAAFEGVHTEPQDDGDCTTALVCSMCKEHTFKEAKEHKNGERLDYTSFAESGVHYVGCINDGCAFGTTEEQSAIFTCLGYSCPENGNGQITIGYKVNGELVDKYEKINGREVKFGLFVVSQEKLGDGEIFGSDGSASSGVLSVETSSFNFDIFTLKIVGFTEANGDAKIAMGAYVAVTDDDATAYSYLQPNEPKEGESYSFVSYNELIKTLL